MTVLRLEKGEADEETTNRVQCKLSHQVAGVSPVGLGVALQKLPHLVEPRCGKLRMQLSGNRRATVAVGDLVQLFLDAYRLGRLLPDFEPVLNTSGCRSGANDIEHIFSL